ncbi:MAG: hypothetical protein HYZ72_16865, partial [Deltaproteobacteria bacterium]|nr:hypothetical protein [Deltaproteobacteria bacterium]
MAKPLAPFSLRYDPRLIKEAIFLAVRGHPEERALHAEGDRLYALADAEARDRAFQQHDASWFVRLGLGAPIEQAFAEQPSIAPAVRGCMVGRALSRKDEGAELFVSPSDEGCSERDRRSVGLLLRPESLLNLDALLSFLRHELFHIADMLDPDFAYEPTLPQSEGGPVYDRLLRDRYRALWDATIDGRLVRRGWASASVREPCLRDFAKAFPMLHTAEKFVRFFDTEPHTHLELVAFACDPDEHQVHRGQSGRCPLCRFPTSAFEPNPERLPAAVIARITHDFPAWYPSRGLCPQCADLYRAQPLS